MTNAWSIVVNDKDAEVHKYQRQICIMAKAASMVEGAFHNVVGDNLKYLRREVVMPTNY